MRYTIDSSVRRSGGGRVVLGGSPLKIFRLTAAGAALFERVVAGESLPTNQLLDRLIDAGVIHPLPPESPATSSILPGLADVTVVIPAYHTTPARLAELVARAGPVAAVIIVDDASSPPLPPVPGATLLRLEVNGGPAAARAAAMSHVQTPLVAFVDTDISLPTNWLAPLLAHFADPRVAAVAPRVASESGQTTLQRYESTRSPLDLGCEPARVSAGTRISYVPSAVLLCRVEPFVAAGGFDTRLRVGEDVDLIWRLVAAGHRVRYDPAVTVEHQPRSTLHALIRQRYQYGGSGAPLATRHPGALAPVRIDRWSAGSWFLAVAGLPVAGLAVAVGSAIALARKLRELPDGSREAFRLAGLGHLYAGQTLAAAATRAWWPLWIVPLALSRRARWWCAAAVVIPSGLDWYRSRPPLDPLSYIGLRLVDDAAYGAGLWVGCIRERNFDALMPRWSRAKDLSAGAQA